jgi:hypothetical protein
MGLRDFRLGQSDSAHVVSNGAGRGWGSRVPQVPPFAPGFFVLPRRVNRLTVNCREISLHSLLARAILCCIELRFITTLRENTSACFLSP